jgi:hypothetical protein
MSARPEESNDEPIARRMWRLLETLHSIVYFAPEAKPTYGAVGLKGYWMGYFASRSAPMGRPSAEEVTAAFYNFKPKMVARAIPDAWSFSTPEDVLRARLQVVDIAWHRLLPDEPKEEIRDAVDLLRKALERCDPAGRVLFAGHASLPWPETHHLALWHAATLYREYRGDGHVALLLAHEIGPREALVLSVASGAMARDAMQPYRGWTDEEWDEAVDGLVRRGLVRSDATLTDTGVALKRDLEAATDRLSSAPWDDLDGDEMATLERTLAPLARAVVEGGGIPFPNPIGMSRV